LRGIKNAMRRLVIDKIPSLQYRLGKLTGRKKANRICIALARIFTDLFGREACDDKG
jgi:hypothetical protein